MLEQQCITFRQNNIKKTGVKALSLTTKRKKAMNLAKKYTSWGTAVLGAVGCFLFFQLYIPYHLFHREQTSLFLYSEEFISPYLNHAGGPIELLGDFLTQFFYFIGGGATVITLSLLLVGWACFHSLRKLAGYWVALPLTLAITLWEAGRECLPYYPLASTLSVAGGFALFLLLPNIRKPYIDLSFGFFLLLLGHLLIGYGVWITVILLILQAIRRHRWINMAAFLFILLFLPFKPMPEVKAWGKPNFYLESLMAMDTHAYFGHWGKVSQLAAKDLNSNICTYYYNLSNALKGELADRLMQRNQPFTKGLFLPVDPSGNYFTFMAVNELWFQLGDMTLAEHSAILGMIFSPRQQSSRILKRMAEINLVNGDEEAALKYLRMLGKTWKYREWAENRMPGQQTEAVQRWLELKRSFIPKEDTLRHSADVRLALKSLLESNPNNHLTYHYLLCHDLLNKNIYGFMEDFRIERGITSRIYQEACLIYLANTQKTITARDLEKYHIAPQVMEEFKNYTQIYEQNHGNGVPLQAKYGRTYWFYFHFATKKK